MLGQQPRKGFMNVNTDFLQRLYTDLVLYTRFTSQSNDMKRYFKYSSADLELN